MVFPRAMNTPRLREWMGERGIVSFKAFSSQDACDMPDGWEKPEEFKLDLVVFHDRSGFHVFGDPMDHLPTYMIDRTRVDVRDLNEMEKWIDDLPDGTTMVGFGSSKFDIPLIESHAENFDLIKQYDLLEEIGKASAKHYESHARRYQLHNLATWNNVKQDVMPLLFYLFHPFAAISAWKKEQRINVARSMAADTMYLRRLMNQIEKHGSLRVRSEETDKLIRLDVVNPLSVESMANRARIGDDL